MTARKFFLLLLGYFGLQIILRVLIFPNAELDEAEQLVMTQEFRWGYGVQPPLYTWLQMIFFGAFGVNVLALALLKNLVLAGTPAFTFLAVKAATRSDRHAALAAAALFLLPQFAWESQRDQTHSVLATMLAAAAFYFFVRALQTRAARDFALVGLTGALGCMSKYNYAVFLVALPLAALSLRELRVALLHRRALVALAVFALVAAPHVWWMTTHTSEVLARSSEVHEHAASFAAKTLASAGSLVAAVVGFSGLAVLIFAAVIFRAPRTPLPPEQGVWTRLAWRILLVGLLLCAAMVVGAQAHFKDRWMQPLLFLTPLALTLWLQTRLDARRGKILFVVSCVVAVSVQLTLAVTPFWAAATGHHRYLLPDFSQLATRLRADGFERGVIVANNRRVAGNLRLHFPANPVCTPECPLLATPAAPRLVVWSVESDEDVPPTAALTNFAAQYFGVAVTAEKSTLVETPLARMAERKTRFAFLIAPR